MALPKELFDGFAWMVLSEELEINSPSEIPIEMGAVLYELKTLFLKEKLTDLSIKVRELEEGGEKERLAKLKEEFKNLAEKLHSLEEKAKQGIILDD